MRHRMGIGSLTGLGNPEPPMLDNEGKITTTIARMFSEGVDLYLGDICEGCDYHIDDTGVVFGYEPAYQFEPLLMVGLCRNKDNSYLITGRAVGDYGSHIIKKTKFYSEYKYKSKFTKFIDKWHEEIFGKKEEK